MVGEGQTLTYEMCEVAHRCIASGAGLICASVAYLVPPDGGPRPGCGAIVALLETASAKKAYHFGKPYPFMMRAARKRVGLVTDEITMIGDTMETDIRAATDLRFCSVLVLTGTTERTHLADCLYHSNTIVESIAQLLLLAAVTI